MFLAVRYKSSDGTIVNTNARRMLKRGHGEAPPLAWFDQPLTGQQIELMRLLADTFVAEQAWPNWRWLQTQLGMVGDAVLRDLPRTGVHEWTWGHEYGYVWVEDGRQTRIPPEATVRLTVAGLARAGAAELVDGYLATLTAAVQTSKNFPASPTEVIYPSFSSTDAGVASETARTLAGLPVFDLLDYEPPFRMSRRSSTHQPDGLTWSFQIADAIRRYEGVTSIEAYLRAATTHLQEINAESNSQMPFPISLVTESQTASSKRKKRLLAWLRENTVLGISKGLATTVGTFIAGGAGTVLALIKNHLG